MALTWARNLGWLMRHDLAQEVGDLMATMEAFAAALQSINEATDELAVEVARLREIIAGGGMTAAQEQDVLQSLADLETKLRAIGTEPPV